MTDSGDTSQQQIPQYYTIPQMAIQFLMLLTIMAIAILRFINTRSQLKTNDLKNEYFENKNKKKWKQYTV